MKYFLITIILLSSTLGMAQENPDSRTRMITDHRLDLEVKMENKPYYAEEHSSIKSYFTELQYLISDLKNSRRYHRRFSSHISNVGMDRFCNEIILKKFKWDNLIINCTRNNFFLCSEEVRLYPEIKAALWNVLGEAFEKAAKTSTECQ